MNKSSRNFVPHRDQIDCAKRRICGYLERNHGAVNMGSASDIRTLHSHISQPRDLGCSFEQQCATLKKALEELTSEKKIAWDSSKHMLGVTYPISRPKKPSSSQRYPVRRAMRRAVA